MIKVRSLSHKYELYTTHDNKVIVYSPMHSMSESIDISDETTDDDSTSNAFNNRSSTEDSKSIGSSADTLSPNSKLSQNPQPNQGDEVVKAKVLQFFPEDGSFEVDVQYDDYAPTLDCYKTEAKVHGIIGLLDLHFGKYLFYITQKSFAGSVGEKSIFRIEKVDCISIYRKNYLTLQEEHLEKEGLGQLLDLLNQGFFYFSYDYDLTNSCQRYMDRLLHLSSFKESKKRRVVWPYEVADEQFFWNRYLMLPLLLKAENCKEFILPIICGYVGHLISQISYPNLCLLPHSRTSVAPEEQNVDTDLLIIARKHRKRAGTRYFRRGVDMEGFAAITVETETIVKSYSRLASFVQIRASAPWIWAHEFSMDYKFPIVMDNENSQVAFEAMKKHFDKLIENYDTPIVCFNLLDTLSYEQPLQKIVEQNIKKYIQEQNGEEESVVYHSVDLNSGAVRRSRNGNRNTLLEIFTIIKRDFSRQGWFVASTSTSEGRTHSTLDLRSERSRYSDSQTILHVLKKQRGVFRVNCLDCLDRTNMVQSLVIKRSLVSMLGDLGYNFHNLDEKNYHDLDLAKCLSLKNFKKFQEIVNSKGNQVAKFYTGTNTFTTCDGGLCNYSLYRKVSTKLKDVYVSFSRYHCNRFGDADKQDAIDLMLGNHRGSIFEHLDKTTPKYPVLLASSFVMYQYELEKRRSFTPIKYLSEQHTWESIITEYLILLVRYLLPRNIKGMFSIIIVLLWTYVLFLWRNFIGLKHSWAIGRIPKSGMKSWNGDESIDIISEKNIPFQ